MLRGTAFARDQDLKKQSGPATRPTRWVDASGWAPGHLPAGWKNIAPPMAPAPILSVL